MRCLVVGGGGFLGSHLVDQLLGEGHEVRVLEVVPRAPADTRAALSWMQGDFLAPAVAREATRDCEVVYHLASTTVPKTANDDPVFDITSNIAGSVTLIQQAMASKVRHLVYVSSGGTVYGIPQAIPIPETHPTHPVSAYGIGKLAVEKYLNMYHHLYGLGYCALRLSNPFGPRQRPDKAQGVVTAFLQGVLQGQELQIWGDGSVVRDYMYVGDAVQAMSAAGRSSFCGVLNVGSGKGLSLNEVLTEIEAVLGVPTRRQYLPGRRFDVPANVLDVRRVREVLGWEARTAFRDGLAMTAVSLAAAISPSGASASR